MKKLLIAAVVAFAVPAFAHGPVGHERAVRERGVEKANKQEKLNEGKALKAMFIEKTKIAEH